MILFTSRVMQENDSGNGVGKIERDFFYRNVAQ